MILTNKLNLPQPFVDVATNDHEYTEGRYSVTELLGGTCEAILKRRHSDELTDDVADMVWAIFGSAVHEILQNSNESESQLKENWIECQLDGSLSGYSLSGIFDLYDDSTGIVTDYKTAGTIKWQKQEFDDYKMQVLLYCWMLQQMGFEAWNGEIVMILRDWVKSKARFDSDYPQHQVQKVAWRFNNHDMELAENFIAGWFTEVQEQEKRPDSQLIPCTQEQRWHKDDKWAVVKLGAKRATRVLDSEDAANSLAAQLSEKQGKGFHVEYRKGEDTKCLMYCPVAQFCPHGQTVLPCS